MSSRIYMLKSTIEEAKFRFWQTEQSSLDNKKGHLYDSTWAPRRSGAASSKSSFRVKTMARKMLTAWAIRESAVIDDQMEAVIGR